MATPLNCSIFFCSVCCLATRSSVVLIPSLLCPLVVSLIEMWYPFTATTARPALPVPQKIGSAGYPIVTDRSARRHVLIALSQPGVNTLVGFFCFCCLFIGQQELRVLHGRIQGA